MCLLSPLLRAQATVDTARMKPPFTSGECHLPEGQLEARPLVAEVNSCQEVSRRLLKELGEEGTGGWGAPGPSSSRAGDPRALTTVQTGHPGLDGRGLRGPRAPAMWPEMLGSHQTWIPSCGPCEPCPHHDDKGPEQGSLLANPPAPSAVLVLKMLVNKWL